MGFRVWAKKTFRRRMAETKCSQVSIVVYLPWRVTNRENLGEVQEKY
jgi:hypothetical protein